MIDPVYDVQHEEYVTYERKLIKPNSGATVLISIPACMVRRLGLTPDKRAYLRIATVNNEKGVFIKAKV
jgi:hypothetical protein